MTGISFFSFNGKRNSNVIPLQGKKRPAWAPLERTFLEVPHYPGGRLIRTQTKMRKIIIPVALFYESMEEAEKLKEEIANWLITDQPQELIFDDEKDRTYLALIDESFDPQQLVNLGEGVLTFVCEMPYKLGPTKTVEFEMDGRGLIANVQNKGTVHSNPIIEIEITKPNTFLDVWFGGVSLSDRDYFRIGMPLKTVEKPVERNQRLIWDEMATTVGWSKVSSMEDGEPVGEMKSDKYQFYCSDFGTGKGWHGAAVKKSIPGGPVEDFIMQAYVTCKSKKINEMGRVEIAILDENSKVLSKIAMNDLYWQAEQNFGTMVIGYDNKPGKTGLIYESGDYPNTWNQYYGRLWIARTGNVWEAYISKFLPGTEKDDSERFARWTDKDNKHMEKAAQIQISIMQWQDVPPVEAMTVSDLKFWKVNLNNQNTPPYIVDVGDKVVIDTENSHVTIEGKNAINIKEFFSNFPVINKGINTLEIMPSDIGTAKVTYRERFR
ncbi:TPA: phage tail family protein [Bacillus thuringiensis]|uniref:Distal tail protein n=2 Tax=root TaxID=1 RepID=A0A0S2MV63_9CAUD|nr:MULTISPECIES: distal tail protein Dit [Bacillus cereus group]YP_009218149.1 tail protein [Bacillus phage phi4J1]ALO79816.1 distal tail protein [Bacillus phage phi4J1]ETE99320.1 phage tail protein [Bacillus thuringiensis serovar aizawai str. Hu4-2]KMQ24988.1 phage tail protein [Bacillus cereus]MDQ8725355.1 phage tail family protein [Bacillus thuringiensis serovar aizawai]MEC2476852.1 phage tail family protein [Bacillus cereus]